jgi:hydrogenase maturation protease
VTAARVLVIGVGNPLRHDDGAGLEVARALRRRAPAARVEVCEHEGETLGLLVRFEDADAVVIVDAVRSGAAPGSVRRVEATGEPVPAELRSSSSTHAVGLAEAIELARALGRLPERVILYGLEGARFDAGSGLSPAVGAAVPALVEEVLAEARRLGG